MKVILKIFVLFICLTFPIACQKSSAPRYETSKAPAAPVASAPSQAPRHSTEQTDKQAADTDRQEIKTDPGKRKIIKEGDLVFETRDYKKTKALLEKSVREVQGYIAEETLDKHDDRIETRTVIRVPVGNFDKLTETLAAGAETIDRKNVRVLDVTEEYIDLEARLRTRKDIEDRYRQLLGQAKKVDEVLNIEKQIGAVREQIESAEGKLKYFNDRIVFSKLTVVYYEKVNSPVGFMSKFVQGLGNGWNNFALFIVLLVNIWPFIILIVLALLIFRKIRGIRGSKKDKQAGDKQGND